MDTIPRFGVPPARFFPAGSSGRAGDITDSGMPAHTLALIHRSGPDRAVVDRHCPRAPTDAGSGS